MSEGQGDVWSCGRLVLYGISSSFEAVLRFSVTVRF